MQPCMIKTIVRASLSLSRLERVWSYHSFAVCRWACDNASSGFNGPSMMMRSAPRPVKTPPTEVASRQPWAVWRFRPLSPSFGRLSRLRSVARALPLQQ